MNFLASDWSTDTESSRVHVSCSVLVLKSDEGNTEQAGGRSNPEENKVEK